MVQFDKINLIGHRRMADFAIARSRPAQAIPNQVCLASADTGGIKRSENCNRQHGRDGRSVMQACNSTLFSHESPLRGNTGVTRKVTRGISNITQSLEPCLYMGNRDALLKTHGYRVNVCVE